jgi:transcriptional regulator of met regulon
LLIIHKIAINAKISSKIPKMARRASRIGIRMFTMKKIKTGSKARKIINHTKNWNASELLCCALAQEGTCQPLVYWL